MSGALFSELAKPHRRVFYDRKWLRLERAAGTFLPAQLYMLALLWKAIFPQGIFVAHIDRRDCILFPVGHAPKLMDLEDGLQLLRGRLCLGLALSRGQLYIIQFGKYKSVYNNVLQAVIRK